jgi:hypothetical protein
VTLGKSVSAYLPAVLLLLPGAYICADDVLPREIVTAWVKQIPGIKPHFIAKLVESLLANRVPDLEWKRDERLGWINNWSYRKRNPDSPMSVLGFDDFRFVHRFLGKNLNR